MRSRLRLCTVLPSLGLLAALVSTACSPLEPNETTASGTFRTLLATEHDGTKRAIHRLELPDGRGFELEFGGTVPPVESGSQVLVRGEIAGRLLQVFDLVAQERAPLALVPSSDGYDSNLPLDPLNVAVLLLGNTSMTVTSARKRLNVDFTGAREFYRHNTYGAWNIAGDAFGPYDVNTSNCGTRYVEIATEARAAAAAAGVDVASYVQTPMVLPGCSAWGGLGELGTTPSRVATVPNYGKPHIDSWYAGSLSCIVLNQELGHNYGITHSHYCPLGPTDADGGCDGYIEYGDSFTPLGNGCFHLNAVEVGFLSAFAPCNVVDVTDGTYEIGPIETTCFGPQVLRFKDAMSVPRAEYVYVEYRKRIGHDANIAEGIYLHYGPEFSDPDIVDWSIHNSGTSAYLVRSRQRGLVVGESWTALGGATFKVLELGDTARIEVTGAGSGVPRCRDGSEAPLAPERCCEVDRCDAGGTGGGGSGGEGGASGSSGDGGTSGSGASGGSGGSGAGGSGGDAGSSGSAGDAGGAGDAGSGGSGGAGGDAGSAGSGASGGEAGSGGGASGEGGSSGEGGGSGGAGEGGSSGGSGGEGDAGSAGSGGSDAGSGGAGGEEPSLLKPTGGGCDCRQVRGASGGVAPLFAAFGLVLWRLRRGRGSRGGGRGRKF